MTTEAQKKATIKYSKKHILQKNIKLNKETDADIIQHLEKQDNVNGYLKDLIRKDIED